MLSKKFRLPATEFRGRGWKTAATPHFLLKGRENGLVYGRFAAVISSKTEKGAARRNFWKRQASSAFPFFPAAGRDVLLVFSRTGELTKKIFRKEFAGAFSRIARNGA